MAISFTQPLLLPPNLVEAAPPFEPLPHGRLQYVPVLQNRWGEMRALEEARPETWACMTPLIVAVGARDPMKALTSTQLAGWAKRLSAVLGEHTFFLDVMRFEPPQALGGEWSALSYLYDRLRSRRLAFVPVLPVSAGPGHQELVRAAAAQDQRGAALRYKLQETALPTGMTHGRLLETRLSAIGLPRQRVDVILDLGWLSPDVSISAADICEVVDEVATIAPWRNVVLVGTSMPATLAAISEGSLGGLPRTEWDLWTEVTGASRGRQVSFGDYAIQHPRPPQDTGPGMRANIRYTAANRTVIARGEGSVTQGGASQYPELCRMITGLDDFETRNYSWGDGVIEECAGGGSWSASQTLWRGAGTSHHLRLVTDQLRALAGP
jgi:hypothetical protein